MSDEKKKPVILWTCDVVGWAYHTRIMRLSKAMSQYEHRIWYFGAHMPQEVKMQALREADIIVCQGVKALRISSIMPLAFDGTADVQMILDARFDKIVVRLDSMRVDYRGQYYDIWSGEKVPE